MPTAAVIGIDLAKQVFHVFGADAREHKVLSKRLSRTALPSFMAQQPPCRVGLEAGPGAHYWARTFASYGHDVRIMNPTFVKPFVKSNKNDARDAEAICEAVTRPTMRFVPVKTVAQQDLQALHRIRSRLVGNRTALVNQIRGLLAEYGLILPRQITQVRRGVPGLLEDETNGLTAAGREFVHELYAELGQLDERITGVEQKLQRHSSQHPVCKELMQIEGVGILTATALVAAVGNPQLFHNGRELAAWLGLVPKQQSSGGRQRLGGISKRGDRYLRTLLIHGARSVVCRAATKTDARSRWVSAIKQRRGFLKACVALANKNARIAWVLMARGGPYRPAALSSPAPANVSA